MKTEPLRQQGYQLLHEGILALSEVEANGFRIDEQRLKRTMEDVDAEIQDLKRKLQDSELFDVWRRRFGAKTNLTSREQLGEVLHKELGFEVKETTATGRPSTDEESLAEVDHPFVADYGRMLKLDKALGTFLKGIHREVIDGYLHPVFNLHTVVTYRSSCESPNSQNFPTRNKDVAKMVRSVFVARKGNVLVENDFKGIEVNVSACYHKDANFISYITTEGKDMHRDMAAQLYCLTPKQVSKEARYGAKNKFVFPQFYGSYWKSCARDLWDWCVKGELKGPNGIALLEHLRGQGIVELGNAGPDDYPSEGTFEHHVQQVEKDFWESRFADYGQWKRDWYATYLKHGYFDLYTGFRISGEVSRKEACNYPIQGSAFHCLLWVLIQVNKRLRHYRMNTKLVGQIHDSLIADVPEEELRDYLDIVEETATVRLRQHWSWIIVPMQIEYEIAPVGRSWFDKREVKFSKGVFTHPTNENWRTQDPSKFLRALGGQNGE